MAWLQLFYYHGPPFYEGPAGNGELWYQGFDGTNWHGVQQIPH